MAPGQHHVRMNMYIAQAKNGRFEIAKSLGAIDPSEAEVAPLVESRRMKVAG
jgi:branched-chain amino acid transport system substrate-binding protein